MSRTNRIALALLLLSAASAAPFREETKTCDPDCSKVGNCNGETGECECPYGLAGPKCTNRLLPACHASLDPLSTPDHGTWYPKNCHCWMQLQNLPIYSYHNLGDLNYMRGVLCFRYKDRPESQQLSDSPTVGDPSIEWGNVTVGLDGRFQFTIMPAAEFPKEVRTTDGELWRPLRECPASCSGRGSCQQKVPGEAQDGSTQPSQPHCVCHAFFVGDACDTPVPSYCYLNCSGVGTCGRRGFCHCQPGIWGLGCTRRKAYVSDKGWQPNHAEMKIYVYDTPQNVVHRQDRDDNWSPHNSNPMIYGAELWFLEKLLGDWTVRTENPWEAALFFVPDFCYFHIGNLGLQHAFFEHITRYLESRPWFNLTVGRNHILTATGDRGVCSLYQESPDGVRPAIHNTIKMVHFGQSPPHHLAGHHHSRHHAHNVTHPPPPPEERFPGFDSFRQAEISMEYERCYWPEKDVVINPHTPFAPEEYHQAWDVVTLANGSVVVTRRNPGPRNTTLFFQGSASKNMDYSQGVRQTLYKMFGKGGKYDPEGPNRRPDYRLGGHDMYHWGMRRSNFCLAPTGHGYTIRLNDAMAMGCVPVIVQDYLYQPLWDVLPYEEFSIRMSRADLHRIVDILDEVTPEQLAKLQAGVDRWHRAFLWDLTGLSYNYTITSLKRRALQLWTDEYRRRQLSS